MPEKIVQSIFVRKITLGDFWNIERNPATDEGGGSQTYIDIPLGEGNSLLSLLWQFLGIQQAEIEQNNGNWTSATIPVKILGNEAAPPSNLTFGPRQNNNRYKISNQARQRQASMRHPAWTDANGFPRVDDNAATKQQVEDNYYSPNLKIFIVKTIDEEYYAGFVNQADMPDTWPKGVGLESLFGTQSSNIINFDTSYSDIPPLVNRILKAWETKQNVLLYGPPGTGKTYAMNFLWRLLDTSKLRLVVDTDNQVNPFKPGSDKVLASFNSPIRREWVTFHQNYNYENFILALLPQTSNNGLTLKPKAGVLMDSAISLDHSIVQAEADKFSTSIIYIDEINRGNVSRIFGEFITFMDSDYRTGRENNIPLPVPLLSVKVENKETEPIERMYGGTIKLPVPWYFPHNIFILASMNSVDRAVTPLDSALARRFSRIEVGPDMEFLARHFGIADSNALLKRTSREFKDVFEEDGEIPLEDIGSEIPAEEPELETAPANPVAADAEQIPALPQVQVAESVAEVAWLLLYRINFDIAVMLGTDFELGHTYVMNVAKGNDENEKFKILAVAWDQAIFPQLQERFVNRPDELQRLLRLDKRHVPPEGYLFGKRQMPSGATSQIGSTRQVLSLPNLENSPIDQVKITLRYLAGFDR